MQKASKNNHNSSKVFQLVCSWLARICRVRSASYFIYGFVIQVISEKTVCNKGFTSKFKRYLYMKVIVTTANLVANMFLSLFCPALETKNKNQVLTKLTKAGNEKYFFLCLSRVVLYFKAIPNLIDFYKEMSLRYSCFYHSSIVQHIK